MLADANEHGKNSWDVLKWDVLKSVGRKYEKGKLCVSVLRTVKSRRGKLVKYKAINELVQYVLSLTDIIYANEHGKKSWDVLNMCMNCVRDVLKWDVLKSVGRKYEKGKLVKYKSDQ